MTDSPVFAAESMGKSFGSRIVLRNASMWVYGGRITVLVGRNGQGKTTLIKTAIGLLRTEYGVVRYHQDRFTRPSLAHLARRGLFYLPERSLLSPSFTLSQHFEAIQHGFVRTDVAGAVERLELGPFLDRRPQSLSGGERRRAEVAIAVARCPECLLADEPFLGIMPKDAEFLAATFKALAADGCAVLITGHEVDTLFDFAHEVLWMTAATTHVLGAPAEARRHDQFRREYLGPY